MSQQIRLADPALAPDDKSTFQEVIAYLRGVTDAVQAIQGSAGAGWPGARDGHVAAHAAPGSGFPADGEPRQSARLTLRHGEAEIALEGVLVVAQTATPFHAAPSRGGTRLVDLEGADDTLDDGAGMSQRGTLPYWAPAVSLISLRPFAGGTERPDDLDEHSVALPYSALALSLVPIGAAIPSGWPEEGCEERVGAIRLRPAPLSAEFYALTGTDDWEG